MDALDHPEHCLLCFAPHGSYHAPSCPRNFEKVTVPTAPTQDTVSALTQQVGGGHYTKLRIQPFEYSLKNKLGAAEHTVVKYVSRWRDKGGIEDLRKARHALDILIEFELEEMGPHPKP